jgi:CHAT domain-containing protein
MLSDANNGEDGFLYPPEIAQLGLSADLVVLSACETAVGPLQGQEGIANLSRAFLFAGGKSVLSTLWQADDVSSALLMKRFYAHIANRRRPDEALTAAKRDVLRKYGVRALPYHWAGFVIEGRGAQRQIESRKIDTHVAQSRDSQ